MAIVRNDFETHRVAWRQNIHIYISTYVEGHNIMLCNFKAFYEGEMIALPNS